MRENSDLNAPLPRYTVKSVSGGITAGHVEETSILCRTDRGYVMLHMTDQAMQGIESVVKAWRALRKNEE